MQNLIPFDSYSNYKIEESESCASCMSEEAKESLKHCCESKLMTEAMTWHQDEDESHTYEDYVNECASYLKEIMGNAGYQSLTKTHAE